MEETTSVAMPPCFEKFCQKLDSAFKTTAQKRELRHYLGGLLGESERKNITQIADNNIDLTYHKLHHFMTDSPWFHHKVNEQRLTIINQCRQTKIARFFSLIVDDSGHRKSGAGAKRWRRQCPRRRKTQGNAHQDSGNFTDGVPKTIYWRSR